MNDPFAVSPTDTLLRLLLPLSDKVHVMERLGKALIAGIQMTVG